jgi:hypothetical protein
MTKTYYPAEPKLKQTVWSGQHNSRINQNTMNNSSRNMHTDTYPAYTSSSANNLGHHAENKGCIQGQCPVGAFAVGGSFSHDNRRT